MTSPVAHPIEILFGDGVTMACAGDGELHSEELHGLFAGDTRVLSTYRLTLGGHPFSVLCRWRAGPSSAQWDMQNPALRVPGCDLERGTVHLRLRRRLLGGLHDDLCLTSFAPGKTPVRLALQLDADFADIFQVKKRSTPARLSVQRVQAANGLSFVFERGPFRRALHLSFAASAGKLSFVGSQILFDLLLEPNRAWTCCVEAIPEVDGRLARMRGDPHSSEPDPSGDASVSVSASPLLEAPFRRGLGDLERLALGEARDERFIAAGAPWFMALFGRDTLVTSLMASVAGGWHAKGALAALGRAQARERDDFRDAEPGKIAHELRHGELARFGTIPHSPYYGTHDAPALYVLALWNAHRWTGDPTLLERHLETARACLRWCRELGDQDGDGLLEYRSRSREGYLNQGWKDAGDAIVHEGGRHAEPPIATVELQGYWFAALLAMAELCLAHGEEDESTALLREASELRRRVEERLWLDDKGCYALALDAHKHPVRSVSSNPGQLLWCGVPSFERARRTARRLLAPDMFSGWGVRTLSSDHPAYNPLSYQRGSVWPHDNLLFAAGLARYGLHAEAARVIRAVLEAAASFEHGRLPELYCGFGRADGPPVPYEEANVPQAWAAAVPLLAVQLFLGLVPDAPHGRCHLWPWLPDWLPNLSVSGLVIGGGELTLKLRRSGEQTLIDEASHPTLELVEGSPPAPLWGQVPPEDFLGGAMLRVERAGGGTS